MPAHLIDAAFEYTFPLHAVASTRYQAVQDVSNPRRHAPNTWQHERQLADHRTRWITAPNNDTLYSNAWNELDSGIREMWQDRISATFEALRHAGMRGRRQVHGWITAGPEIGKFGSNFALRASVALGGLGALEPEEAIYFVRFHDDQGQLLDGRPGHVMTVPASGLPTDSFWSFSMYEPVDGQRYFTANAIDRYALGNRTPDLMYNVDGSLDIALTHSPPTQPHLRANWLPAPSGPFQVSLRCYLPRAELRELRTQMPSCTRYYG